jgi:hypothetical protein
MRMKPQTDTDKSRLFLYLSASPRLCGEIFRKEAKNV